MLFTEILKRSSRNLGLFPKGIWNYFWGPFCIFWKKFERIVKNLGIFFLGKFENILGTPGVLFIGLERILKVGAVFFLEKLWTEPLLVLKKMERISTDLVFVYRRIGKNLDRPSFIFEKNSTGSYKSPEVLVFAKILKESSRTIVYFFLGKFGEPWCFLSWPDLTRSNPIQPDPTRPDPICPALASIVSNKQILNISYRAIPAIY